MEVRKLVFSLGYRYRLHLKDLPGTPDIVFRNRRKVIFVHGCFWHRHTNCRLARMPKSKLEFWKPKLERNRERDIENMKKLEDLGWSILVVWECQIKHEEDLREKLKNFLEFENEVC